MKQIIKIINGLIVKNNKMYVKMTLEEVRGALKDEDAMLPDEVLMKMINKHNKLMDMQKLPLIDDDVSPKELVDFIYGYDGFFYDIDIIDCSQLVIYILHALKWLDSDEASEVSIQVKDINYGVEYIKYVEKLFMLFESAGNTPSTIYLKSILFQYCDNIGFNQPV